MLPRRILTPASRLVSLLTRPKPSVNTTGNILDGPTSSSSVQKQPTEQHPDLPQRAPGAKANGESANRSVSISVVIPAYNAAPFLPRCLQSVFAQTLQPLEVIVVDDGSTDNTAALATELGAKVIMRQNGGISAARNTGIQNASCEWIALLDADDLWEPDKLERQAQHIRPETVLIYTGIRIFDDNGFRREKLAIAPSAATKTLRYRNPITPSSALVKRQVVIDIGGFLEDITGCEDWEMWVRLQREGQFEAVTDPLTAYYIYPNSFSANPEKMLRAVHGIIGTLLADVQGFDRLILRRRILASQLCSVSLIARDNGLKGEFLYMFRSLCAWPSPWWEPRRFKLLAVSVKNMLR
jgi:glycosyltransferase involved in cell wall biosynthesis